MVTRSGPGWLGVQTVGFLLAPIKVTGITSSYFLYNDHRRGVVGSLWMAGCYRPSYKSEPCVSYTLNRYLRRLNMNCTLLMGLTRLFTRMKAERSFQICCGEKWWVDRRWTERLARLHISRRNQTSAQRIFLQSSRVCVRACSFGLQTWIRHIPLCFRPGGSAPSSSTQCERDKNVETQK